MVTRHTHPKRLAAPAAPMAARHVGRGPGLVDEHQSVGFKVQLILEPSFAQNEDLHAVLFGGVCGLFARDGVPSEEALDRADAKARPCFARLARTSLIVAF